MEDGHRYLAEIVYYVGKMEYISIQIQAKYKEHIVAYLIWFTRSSAYRKTFAQIKTPDFML
jgi:hypothetical protein